MLLKYLKIFILLITFSSVTGQSNYEIFDKANILYSEKNYDSAKTLYLNLYNDRMISKELVVPLANFDRIMGSNKISIKPQGSAELIFGLNISNVENPILPADLQRTVTFDFDEKIKMGVTGQIGDKMKIGINYHNGMLAFVFVPMIILISANNGFITRISNYKTLVFLGEISFGIYILQKPVFTWINGIMKYFNIDNANVIFYVSLSVLLISSAISYKFFETPLRKLINKKRITSYE